MTVLTAGHVDQRRLERRLVRAGYTAVAEGGGLRVSRHGRWDAATMTVSRPAGLPRDTVDGARLLLGLAPRTAVRCRFEGGVRSSDSWPTVLDIARAVAAEVPLAVLDDHAGTRYLVHPSRGLVGPEEYERVRGRAATTDFLRRFLGG